MNLSKHQIGCLGTIYLYYVHIQACFLFFTSRDHGVDVVTLGQYMRPTKKHMAVSEFVTPAAFEMYQKVGIMFGSLDTNRVGT